MNQPDDPIHHKRLVHGARFRTLPLNVKCPARCAFCYESRVSSILPHVTTEYIPPYDEESFDAFREMFAKACQWEADTGRDPIYGILPTFDRTPHGISHFPMCDIFSTGLTNEQIEEIVRIREGDLCLLYSVGLNLDPEFIAYLTKKYPETFRLHLSIVTFDLAIRKGLMSPKIDLDVLRRTCTAIKEGTYFLILFHEEQLAEDMEELLSTTSADNGGIFIHKLYYDSRSPKRVVERAQEADRQRKAAVRRIARLRRDSRQLLLALGADIQAFTRRHEIYTMLAPCSGESDEAVFCSKGTFPVIEHFFDNSENVVVPLESAFGGNIDFVQGAAARDVIGEVVRLRSTNDNLRRVFLPDSMFWLDGGYDLFGDSSEVLAEAFPDVSFELLPVPQLVTWSVVGLDDCLAFFDNPQRSTFDTTNGSK